MHRAGTICATLGLALLVGGMIFFGAIVAPLVFTQLPIEVVGPFIRLIFPWYYGFIASAALLAMFGFSARRQRISAAILCAVLIAVLWAWLWLIPHLNAWREAGQMTRFAIGHKISTWLNAAELIAAIWLLLRLVLVAPA
jgi:hypothetical protein